MTHTTNVAIVGCGNIFDRYVEGMGRFPGLTLVGCADADASRASEAAARHGITAYPDVETLLKDDAVDVVVNITTPLAHAEISLAALRAGKHVYVEKPIATTLADAHRVLDAAKAAGRTVGSAPDTFLGSAVQTAIKAVNEGKIGTVIGGTGFVPASRVETWHPDPTFLFQEGGGPILDMGPYYVTALVALLGGVREVNARGLNPTPARTISSPGRLVDTVTSTIDTHVNALLTFDTGAVITLIATFDVPNTHQPYLELYGTEGTLTLPFPNEYDGDVLFRAPDDADWTALEPVFAPSAEPGSADQLLRGPGVADLAAALNGAEHRASGALALHVLDVLEAIATSAADNGRPVTPTTSAP